MPGLDDGVGGRAEGIVQMNETRSARVPRRHGSRSARRPSARWLTRRATMMSAGAAHGPCRDGGRIDDGAGR
jgi:hypothetical protein